jgi:Mitochondrial carrier protein
VVVRRAPYQSFLEVIHTIRPQCREPRCCALASLATARSAGLAQQRITTLYEAIKDRCAMQGVAKDKLGMLPLVVAGGLGGMACWITVYPVDVIKSKLQTQAASAPMYKGLWDCGRQLYRAGGAGALYKGLGPCLARSFPANAAAFLAYETAFKAIKNWAP